jgi:hypothetical protein
MGWEWGPPDPNGRAHSGFDTPTGRPLPPWPPAGVVVSYSTCLGCPRQPPSRRCADCPVDRWEGRTYTPPAPKPERREPFLTRLFRKVTRK